MTVPQVSNGSFIPVALPAPVSWTVRMRPYAKAITAAAPWAGTRIFPTMGTGDPAERRVAAEEVEHDHREPLGDASHSRLYPNETLWHTLQMETTPITDWHPLGTPLDPKTLDRLFAPFATRVYFISY
jgi:hypothetical protein